MIDWKFYIDDLEIEQPQGFNELVLNIMRDEKWHGVIFEASTTTLGFYGDAFDYLKQQKISYSVSASVIFRAEARCAGESEYENAITGKLNFSNYRERCGNICLIILGVEQTSCAMTLKNRMDHKVSVGSNIAVDGITSLPDYTGLGFEMELATQAIPVSVEGYVTDEPDIIDVSIFTTYGGDPAVRPTYGRAINESIETSQLIPGVYYSSDNFIDPAALSPVLLLEDIIKCFSDNFEYSSRLKGTFDITFIGPDGEPNPGVDFFFFKAVLGKGIWNTFPPPDHQTGDWDKGLNILDSADVSVTVDGDHWTGSFDFTFAGTTPLAEGEGLYAYLCWEGIGGVTDIKMVGNITFDSDTHILISASRECPPTPADVYLVNETLSRIAESITNRCLTVESDYYGRIDSQPYAKDEDGCGSMRVLTNGLKIRQAEDKEFFASMNDVLDGLNAIDNIGFAIEQNLTQRLRIEPVEYFYKDEEIMKMDLIPDLEFQLRQSLIKTLIKVGYKKWEIQSVKGIDEFNSNKDFATGVTGVSNTLDITSGLIAAGYIIEDLRTRTLASTGREDTTYDNDVFVISVIRQGYGYAVEQGNIDNPANIFSPGTAYNWRIRPMYNLIRWAKSIFNAYPVLADTASKLFFRSGVGNYEAEGELPVADTCRLENVLLAKTLP